MKGGKAKSWGVERLGFRAQSRKWLLQAEGHKPKGAHAGGGWR